MDKAIVKSNSILVVQDKVSNNIVYKTSNTQSLYLYPLSILDYINNILYKKPILLNIFSIDNKIEYKKVLSSNLFNRLLCIELVINQDINYNKLSEIIEYAKDNKIRITFNIKDLSLIDNDFLVNNVYFVDYIKCFYKHRTQKQYLEFIDKINIISKYKNKRSLLHIKSYLSEDDVDNYEERLRRFEASGVDIYQVSKELLPCDKNNQSFSENNISKIRELEQQFSGHKGIKFISVKDLTLLYYPRFMLDERNCKHCNACNLKPYLYNEYILPCKVNKVMEDVNKWGETNYDNLDKFNEYGKDCDDCASIFENDTLGFIQEKYLNGNYKFDIICGDNND